MLKGDLSIDRALQLDGHEQGPVFVARKVMEVFIFLAFICGD